MLPFGVKSFENAAKLCSHLKTHLAYPPLFSGVSINPMTTGIVY